MEEESEEEEGEVECEGGEVEGVECGSVGFGEVFLGFLRHVAGRGARKQRMRDNRFNGFSGIG